VFHRSFAVVALVAALFVGACGSNGDSGAEKQPAATAPAEQAEVLVTQSCGRTVVVNKKEVPAGQTAMRALQAIADVETDDGGRFVTAIEGVEQDTGKQLAWLFYVNGKMAEKGAAEIKLQAGDVEWWDLHDWEKNCPVPPSAR
jgi:Domain of unknown function (DUF4430)